MRRKDIKDIKEKEVQTYLMKQLGALAPKPYVVKTIQTNHRGTPDVLVCYRGQFIAIECKRPVGGRLTALQVQTLERIREAGGQAHVVSTYEEADNLIKQLGELS